MSGHLDDMIRAVNGTAPTEFGARLHRLAVELMFPVGGPRTEVAVVLAEDLVATGYAGEATLEVASLRRDAIRSDAEPLVRRMLAEHGIDLPVPVNDDAAYELLLRAFGFWDLPVADVYAPFLNRVPAWEEQDKLDRILLLLFEELDHTTNIALKPAVVERMRAAVRDALT
jgi:hypothetical protein